MLLQKRRLNRALFILAGLTCASAGCTSPYYQNPYGYGSPGFYQPGVPVQQFPQQFPQQYPMAPQTIPGGVTTMPGTVSPQPMFVPNGTEINVAPGGPTYDPSDTLGSGDNNSTNFFQDDNSYQDNRVPAPRDVGSDQNWDNSSDDLSDPSDTFGLLDDPNLEFEQPVRDAPIRNVVSSKPDSSLLQRIRGKSLVPDGDMGHDDEYRWIQGSLHTDPKLGGARILVYDLDQTRDEFAGDFTLTDHPHLDLIRDDEMVAIHGRILRDRRDKHGKPMYHVTTVRIIVPDVVSR